MCQLSGLFLFLAPFNGFSCFLLNIFIGLSPTLVFSAILVKTHLIHTIFIRRLENPEMAGVKMQICPSFIEKIFDGKMSMRARQMLHVTILLVIQFVFVIIWTALMNDQTDIYPKDRHIRVCIANLTKYFTLHIFNFFLILCCTLYGYLVRNVPRYFKVLYLF